MRVRERLKARWGEVFLGMLWTLKSLRRLPGMRKAYRGLLILLVKRTGLFDRAYYLEQNGDVALEGASPLRHYVDYGDREGRRPMPFFDPNFYRAHAPGRTKNVNALLHYATVGRYRRISTSPWFDVAFYLANNKDVARSGLDPLVHYLRYGGLEGRSPCSQFDGSYYLRANPDILEMRLNPLVHYLLLGRLEGRPTLPGHPQGDADDAEAGSPPLPPLPSEESWLALRSRSSAEPSAVAVVVPVYKGRVETLRCLHSVLSAVCRTPFELVVINDASPDKELAGQLREMAGQGMFKLIENPENRGFVHSVNRGMLLYRDRDVVLLNSDTEVYDHWLDRLHAVAYRNESTGTVTPLSNNATICSYPHFLHDNPFPLELGYAELDALTARVNAGVEAEAPTGVGFCMFLKRACREAVGLFDEKAFGKGYGEENDYCQRALHKGWRNVIAADIFVRHWGAASFQGRVAKRVHAALKVLDRLHPRYRLDVAAYIDRDPLAEARRRIDWARLLRMRRERNVLIVSHNRGGGTERHIQEDIQHLSRQGYGVFLLRPMAGKNTNVFIGHHELKSLPNLSPLALSDTAGIRTALSELGITEVHTHSLVDYVPNAPDHVIAFVKSLGTHFEVNLHDYKVICPRINLVNGNGRYCGEPQVFQCNRCLEENGSDFHISDIAAWRAMHRRILQEAKKVLVPDQDVADRLARYFPGVYFEVSPHEDIDSQDIQLRTPVLLPGEKLRVVVIGAISKIKGYDVLLACARDARQRDLPLEFIVMGYGMNDRLLEAAGVIVDGRYLEDEALDRLHRLSAHVVWLPSVWPETYSYTLSLALHAGVPVAAFDLGAIAARLRRIGRAELLMPLSLAARPGDVNAFFMNIAERSLKEAPCPNV